MSDQYDAQKEASLGVFELGAAGTLATTATALSASAVGHVTVATIATAAGVTTVAVSLPAIVAVGAATYLGLSLGGRIVKAAGAFADGRKPGDDQAAAKA